MSAQNEAKRNKYIKGQKIDSLISAVQRIENGLPFYWNHKFMSSKFIEQWSVIQVKIAVHKNRLYSAEPWV